MSRIRKLLSRSGSEVRARRARTRKSLWMKGLKGARKTLAQIVGLGFLPLPTFFLEDVVVRLATRRARRLQADEGLRLLFRVESALYQEQGRLAVRYGKGVHTKHRHMRYHDFFVERVVSDERVLDVGCGIGAVAHAVALRSGADVVGIDLHEGRLEQARRQFRHPRVEYRHGDALKALPDERFDVVILSNVLEHLPDRASFLRSVVRASGARRVLIRVPVFERDWRVPLRKELDIEWRLDDTHETEYTMKEFLDEMRSAGLRVEHSEVRWSEIWASLVPKAAVEASADAA